MRSLDTGPQPGQDWLASHWKGKGNFKGCNNRQEGHFLANIGKVCHQQMRILKTGHEAVGTSGKKRGAGQPMY